MNPTNNQNQKRIIRFSNKISMKFVFDEEKLKKDNLSSKRAMAPIQKYFQEHNISETKPGFFEGDNEKDWPCFASCLCSLMDAEWFLKYIKEWEWYVDNNTENCL